MCAGLPLDLGIAGSGVKLDYEDRKDASFSAKNYCSELLSGLLNQLLGANAEYYTGGLKYVVEASLQLCEQWGFRGGRNMDMGRLFRSLCVLEEQKLTPERALKRYWGLDNRQVGEIVRKFNNLNIVKRDLLKRSTKQWRQYRSSLSACTIWYSNCVKIWWFT